MPPRRMVEKVKSIHTERPMLVKDLDLAIVVLTRGTKRSERE